MKMASISNQVKQGTPIRALKSQRARIKAVANALNIDDAPKKGWELTGPDGQRVAIPEPLFAILSRVAEVLGKGDAVTVVPVGKELTTQQAANILNVSRQYLVRILDDGHLPFTKTGRHRRVLVEDLLKYKVKRDKERKSSLAKLTKLSEEMDGYRELE